MGILTVARLYSHWLTENVGDAMAPVRLLVHHTLLWGI